MTEYPCCRNCPYAGPVYDNSGRRLCRRFPPVPLPPAAYGKQPGYYDWPTVYDSQLCGEHPRHPARSPQTITDPGHTSVPAEED